MVAPPGKGWTMFAMEHLFSGSAVAPIDAQCRLTLPAFVMSVIGHRSPGGIVVIGPHEADPCMTAFGRDHFPALASDTERRRLRDENSGLGLEAHFARARRAFGFVEEAVCDSRCRVRLTPWIREKGRLERHALVVGTGATFEIWNPELACEAADASLRALAAYRLGRPIRTAQREEVA